MSEKLENDFFLMRRIESNRIDSKSFYILSESIFRDSIKSIPIPAHKIYYKIDKESSTFSNYAINKKIMFKGFNF